MISEQVKDFYKQFSLFTDAGPYLEYYKLLPNDIHELRDLVCAQHTHKSRIARTYSKEEISKNYSWLNCLDDALQTATAMTSEIFRLNPKGYILDKPNDERIIVTCRYIAVLFASILKSKGISTRCRAGFAPYIYEDYNVDHWINEYWSEKEKRWIAIDAQIKDTTRTSDKNINLYDINGEFEYPAQLWLKARRGELTNLEKYLKHTSYKGLDRLAWALFLDFNSLMNVELLYRHKPMFVYEENFSKLTTKDYEEIDRLAELMLYPDENFELLKAEWENNEKFRVLRTPYVNPFTDW